MACNECNKVTVQECDSELCPFELSSDCVIVPKLECIDTKEGEKLTEVLSKMDEAICQVDSDCEIISWTNITGGREGIETLQYFTTCQDEVKLKGTIDLDDFISGGSTGITFPIPPAVVRFSLNFLDVGVVGVGLFEILADGTSKFYFNNGDIPSDPPTIILDFTGLSYFI